jgi:hypothetical protein
MLLIVLQDIVGELYPSEALMLLKYALQIMDE